MHQPFSRYHNDAVNFFGDEENQNMSMTKFLFMFVLTSLFAQCVYAQSPQRTTATYEDWTVSCALVAQGQQSCEIIQAQTLPGQANPVGQITVSRPARNQPLKIFFQIPDNAWLQTGMKFSSNDNEIAIPAVFRWCVPGRCLADADLSDAAVSRLRSKTEPGRVDYKDATQHDISLPVSLKGLGAALDAMPRQ
jgi:invasion protein IalB